MIDLDTGNLPDGEPGDTRSASDVRAQAEDDQKRYDALNYRDDQFDLADALTAIAISLLALTALTSKLLS